MTEQGVTYGDGVPLLHMGGAPSTVVASVQRAVWRLPTAFSLPHALLAAGLIPLEAVPPPAQPAPGLGSWAHWRWKGDVAALLDEAARAGRLDPARLDPACAPAGTLIGWRPSSALAKGGAFGLCTDLALTILVLERHVGPFYFASRRPDRSWEHLFARGLVVDDPRFVGSPLAQVLPGGPPAGAPLPPAPAAAPTPPFAPDISVPVEPETEWSWR
jgi:hypothetical protein